MEISTGDLIGLTGLGVTVLGGAVALGKIWSKVIANEQNNDTQEKRLNETRNAVSDLRTLTMVQEKTIERLDANSDKLFDLIDAQNKDLGDIKNELAVIIEKLKLA
jgi:predicted RNase H-like nuclease (RuvC/YqgF family)